MDDNNPIQLSKIITSKNDALKCIEMGNNEKIILSN
jgi:hypothetical protein